LRGHRDKVYGARELRDGRLLSWSADTTLRLWAADGTERAVLRGHKGWVLGALELRDGRLLSWALDKTLWLWAANGTPISAMRLDASPSELRAWFAAHTDDQTAYGQFMRARYGNSLTPSGSHHVAARDNVLYLYNAETDEELARFYADSEITVARFLQGGAVIALGCENGQVIFLKVNL
jgi:WD40 repeat protein